MTVMLKKIHLKIDDIYVYIFHAARRGKVTREVWEPTILLTPQIMEVTASSLSTNIQVTNPCYINAGFGLIKNHGIKNVKLLFLQTV